MFRLRSLLACLFVCVLALPLLAQPLPRKYAAPQVTEVSGVDGSAFAAMMRSAKPTSGGLAPKVAFDESSNAMVFPLVGNAPGANGAFFRSEATIVNNLNRRQVLRVFFFPLGGNTCSGVPIRDLTLEAFNFYVYSDFVAQVFGLNGLGSLGMVAIDNFGNADTSARVDADVRIYTATLSGVGSASQSFQGVGLTTFGGNQTAFGIRHDTLFHTNYGIFNYLGFTRTFDVDITGINAATSTTVTVGACSVGFAGLPAINFGSLVLDIRPRDTQGGWYGFASSVDNLSGDSWSVSARPN